jgi:hypothetical protein
MKKKKQKKKKKNQMDAVLPFGLPENRTPWVAGEQDVFRLGWIAGDLSLEWKRERETRQRGREREARRRVRGRGRGMGWMMDLVGALLGLREKWEREGGKWAGWGEMKNPTYVFAVLQKFNFFFWLTWTMPRQHWMDAGWTLRITPSRERRWGGRSFPLHMGIELGKRLKRECSPKKPLLWPYIPHNRCKSLHFCWFF